jgi:Sec-independent protein translocase protein TatA
VTVSDPAACPTFFALFSLGGGGIILVLALILILFGAKRIADIEQGLGAGFCEFRKHLGAVLKGFDHAGKPAAQALTPDNQTAELYDPAAFQSPRAGKHAMFGSLVRLCWLIWRRVSKRFGLLVRTSLSRWK